MQPLQDLKPGDVIVCPPKNWIIKYPRLGESFLLSSGYRRVLIVHEEKRGILVTVSPRISWTRLLNGLRHREPELFDIGHFLASTFTMEVIQEAYLFKIYPRENTYGPVL